MIDVVFLLLIFFICAATGAVQESLLATDLAPTGGVASESPVKSVDPVQIETWLKLARGTEGDSFIVTFNDTEFTDLDRLEATLQAMASIDASNPVILDIAADITLGEMVDIYDRCRRAGLESVNFAADTPAN